MVDNGGGKRLFMVVDRADREERWEGERGERRKKVHKKIAV